MFATEVASPRSRRMFFRFWFPCLVLIAAVAGMLCAWLWPSEALERAFRVTIILAIGFVTFLVLNLWLFFSSRQRWWLALGGFVMLAAAVWAAVPEMKKDGDLVPTFLRFRWQASQDEIVETHRRQQGVSDAPPAVDLSKIEPADFPEYRGRRRDGIVEGPPLARAWKSQPPRLLWRQPVGGGYSGFAVAGKALVTLEQRRDQEAVVCYDAATGRQLWIQEYPAHFKETLGGPGPRATPTIAGSDVYSLGATGQLVCLEGSTGRLRWSRNILEDNKNLPWAMSGSPLVYDDVVVVNPGAQTEEAKGRALAAFDRQTGKPVWNVGDYVAGYSSPMLATLAGRRQILLLDGAGLSGYDPKVGKELWRFPWPTYQDINVAQPVVLDNDRVFISSGYNVGCAMLKVSEAAGRWSVEQLWRNSKLRSKFANPVAYQEHLYGLDDGTLVCLDQKTGERKWKGDRYGHCQLLLTHDLLVILSETGKLAIVEAVPGAFRELSSIQAISGRTWNYPALAGGKVYVRNDTEMAGFDLRSE